MDSLRTKLIMTSYWMAMYPVISQDRKIIIMKNYYKETMKNLFKKEHGFVITG